MNPKPAPIIEPKIGKSEEGNKENEIPIMMRGMERTSGIMPEIKSVKKIIIPNEKRTTYLK